MTKPHVESVDWNRFFVYRDGSLYWKEQNHKRNRRLGVPAGGKSGGYQSIRIHVDGVRCRYYAHQIIAAMHGIEIGSGQVDHKNGDTFDNRIENHGVINDSLNIHNTTWNRGRSRFRGVAWISSERKWRATFKRAGETERRCLGHFDDEEEAARACDAERMEYLLSQGYDPADFSRAFNFPEELEASCA